MRIGYKNAWILTMDDAFTEYRSGYLVMEEHHYWKLVRINLRRVRQERIDAHGGILLPVQNLIRIVDGSFRGEIAQTAQRQIKKWSMNR